MGKEAQPSVSSTLKMFQGSFLMRPVTYIMGERLVFVIIQVPPWAVELLVGNFSF